MHYHVRMLPLVLVQVLRLILTLGLLIYLPLSPSNAVAFHQKYLHYSNCLELPKFEVFEDLPWSPTPKLLFNNTKYENDLHQKITTYAEFFPIFYLLLAIYFFFHVIITTVSIIHYFWVNDMLKAHKLSRQNIMEYLLSD